MEWAAKKRKQRTVHQSISNFWWDSHAATFSPIREATSRFADEWRPDEHDDVREGYEQDHQEIVSLWRQFLLQTRATLVQINAIENGNPLEGATYEVAVRELGAIDAMLAESVQLSKVPGDDVQLHPDGQAAVQVRIEYISALWVVTGEWDTWMRKMKGGAVRHSRQIEDVIENIAVGGDKQYMKTRESLEIGYTESSADVIPLVESELRVMLLQWRKTINATEQEIAQRLPGLKSYEPRNQQQFIHERFVELAKMRRGVETALGSGARMVLEGHKKQREEGVPGPGL